jgi:predicted Zn finger-like uncharacterized protein
MSLITSCPACGTMFRVVPDQLKISEGWVRCGHCSEVFDATAHLSDEAVLGPVADAQTTRSAPLEAQAEVASPPSPPAAPVRPPPTAPVRPPAPAPAIAARAPAEPDSGMSSDPSDFFGEEVSDSQLEPSPLDAPFVFRRSEVTLSQLEPEPGRESQMLPDELERAHGQEDLAEVSFVRQARRRQFWRRPLVRVFLALLVLVLAGVLLLQAAWQDRDRLALAQPALRPALERMCEVLRCTLGAPRQIESIVIESSGFNRLRNDTYRLAFTLRNTASVPVAAPTLELTITDAQDQTIARRVLTPAELGAGTAVIPAAGEWSRTAGVVLATDGGPRVAGYRLLAFYP